MRKIIVTSKNVGKVMQVLNTFFRHSTAEIFPDQIQIKRVTAPDGTHGYERVPYTYVCPSLGYSCHWHHMYKEYKNSFLRFSPPLLAISSIYESSCTPLYEGDQVIYKGSQVTIITHIPDLSNPVTHKRTFYHTPLVPEQIEEEYQKLLDASLYDTILDDECLFNLLESDAYEEEAEGDPVLDLANELRESIKDILSYKPFSERVTIHNRAQDSDVSFTLVRKLDLYKTNPMLNEETPYAFIEVTFAGETFSSTNLDQAAYWAHQKMSENEVCA